jgi:hypothetical protein
MVVHIKNKFNDMILLRKNYLYDYLIVFFQIKNFIGI